MTERNDTSHLMVGNAPPKHLIRTILKQIRIIPNKELHNVKEPIPIMLGPTLRNPTSN